MTEFTTVPSIAAAFWSAGGYARPATPRKSRAIYLKIMTEPSIAREIIRLLDEGHMDVTPPNRRMGPVPACPEPSFTRAIFAIIGNCFRHQVISNERRAEGRRPGPTPAVGNIRGRALYDQVAGESLR